MHIWYKYFFLYLTVKFGKRQGSLWSWSYGIWIYDYICNQCLSPL